MSEEYPKLLTAEMWEAFFLPELRLHSHHGFGSSYNKGPNEDYYTLEITLEDFKRKCVLCSVLSWPKEWAEKSKTNPAEEETK